MTAQANAYQNGMQLKTPSKYVSKWKDEETGDYIYANSGSSSIQPGYTIRTAFIYQLEELNSDVTFELSTWGFSKVKLRKIIEL